MPFPAQTCYTRAMPGSGPIDPDKILQIIHGGADHQPDHLMVSGQARWLRVDGGAWEIADTSCVRIDRAAFDALQSADPAVVNGCIRIGGDLYRLDEVSGYAVLNPA